MLGQTIVACCRFKSFCATCCKTPSVSSTVSPILQSVVTELLRDTFNLCSRHFDLRYLQSVFSVSCSYTPSVCFLGTVYWHFFMCVISNHFSETSMCVLRNPFPQVLKFVLSAPSSYTLPICPKHRIAGYIILWQCLCLYVSTQYDARLVKIALVSDVWNASVSPYIAVYMSASLPTDTSTYLTAHSITYPPTHPPTYIHQPIYWSP